MMTKRMPVLPFQTAMCKISEQKGPGMLPTPDDYTVYTGFAKGKLRGQCGKKASQNDSFSKCLQLAGQIKSAGGHIGHCCNANYR